MKYIFLILAILLKCNLAFSQADTTKFKFLDWLSKNIKIGQSMETSDQRSEPAQFQLTMPKNDTSSYLINLGVSVGLNFLSSSNLISKFKTEYHKNTLIEKKQNNFEFGYQGTWNFASHINTRYFVTFDPKYVYDGVEIKNSVASNFLFSWFQNKSSVNWNTNNYYNKKRQSLFLSLFGGAQVQDIFKAKVVTDEGFILRPLYTAAVAFAFNKIEKDNHPLLKLSLTYVGRYDLVNNTGSSEGYTQLLKTGLDWFLVNDPLKISLGTSFNYGSDLIKGLTKQQFWLITINISK